MLESQSAQRDDSPMDIDQPSPLDQDPAPLGRTWRATTQILNSKYSYYMDFTLSR